MKIAIHIRMRPDGGYTACCPALPGCAVKAGSREMVERQMRDAVNGYLESMNTVTHAEMVIAEMGISAD